MFSIYEKLNQQVQIEMDGYLSRLKEGIKNGNPNSKEIEYFMTLIPGLMIRDDDLFLQVATIVVNYYKNKIAKNEQANQKNKQQAEMN